MIKFAAISQIVYSIGFSNAANQHMHIVDGLGINAKAAALLTIVMALIAIEIVLIINKNKELIVRKKEKPKKVKPGTVSVLNRAEENKIKQNQIEVKEIVQMILMGLVYMIIPMFTLKINDFVIFGENLNIFYTLSIGIFSIYIIESFKQNTKIENILLISIYSLMLLSIGTLVDYGLVGCIFVIAMYLARKRKLSQCICLFIFSFIIYYSFTEVGQIFNPYVLSTIFAIPLIILYNGKIGLKMNKQFFYIFYPAHIIIIVIIEKIFNYMHFNVF